MGDSRGTHEVLYYPYAHTDESWLKRALLAWDAVHVIRPAGVEEAATPVGPTEAMIRERLPGFFNPITPRDPELLPIERAIADLFLDTELQRRYGHKARSALTERGAPRSQAAPRDADPRLVWIYSGDQGSKMSNLVAEQLRRRDLAEVLHGGRAHWLGLHPEFAAVYMTALAGQIAGRRVFIPYTDDLNVHRAAGAGNLEDLDLLLTGRSRTQRYDIADRVHLEVIEERYLHYALTATPAPINIDHVPVEALIDFHGEHAGQLQAFREHLATFEHQLVGLVGQDDEDVEARIRQIYTEQTAPLIANLNRRMTRAGMRTAWRSLAVKLGPDALAGTGLGYITDNVVSITDATDPTRAIVSIVVGSLPLLAGLRSEREDSRRPIAYLLAARNELRPDKVLQQITAT